MKTLLRCLLVVALATVLAAPVFAQQKAAPKAAPKAKAAPAAKNAISQGGLWVDGTFSYSSLTYDYEDFDEVDVNTFALAAAGDYFIIDHLGVGGLLGYASIDTDDGDESELKIGPHVLYAFDNFADSKFYPFVDAAFGLEQAKFDIGGDEESENGWFFVIGGGCNYTIKPNLGIIGKLNYSMDSLDDLDISGFNLAVGLVGMFDL